jgi:hypothetical protein
MDYFANNKGSAIFIFCCHISKGKGKSKAIPLQAWSGLDRPVTAAAGNHNVCKARGCNYSF